MYDRFILLAFILSNSLFSEAAGLASSNTQQMCRTSPLLSMECALFILPAGHHHSRTLTVFIIKLRLVKHALFHQSYREMTREIQQEGASWIWSLKPQLSWRLSLFSWLWTWMILKKGIWAGSTQPSFPANRKEYASIGSFAVGFQNKLRGSWLVAKSF